MKKSKNFLFVLFVSVLLPAVFLLSACNYSGSGNVQTPANVRIVNDSLLGWVLQWNPSSPTAQYDVEIRNTNTNETSILRIAGTIFHTNLIGAIETEILYELRVSAVINLPADRTYFSDHVYFGIPSPYKIPAELVALNGNTLSQTALPSGWTWNSPQILLDEPGSRNFYATYQRAGGWIPLRLSCVVSVQPRFEYISAGQTHSIALDCRGQIWTWGNGGNGRLGHGTENSALAPRRIESGYNDVALPTFLSVSAGDTHSMALDTSGNIWTWGNGAHGKLGHDSTISFTRPRQITTGVGVIELPAFTEIDAGDEHNIAVCINGQVWTWGRNNNSALGQGTATNINEYRPRRILGVVGLSGIQQVSAGNTFSMALDGQNRIWTWGWGGQGGLGHGESFIVENRPRLIEQVFLYSSGTVTMTAPAFVSISAGLHFAIALCLSGEIWSWGQGTEGQLGHRRFINEYRPRRISPFSNAMPIGNISAGGGFSMSLNQFEARNWVYTWGLASDGRLGQGETSNVNFPSWHSGLNNIQVISAGGAFGMALDANGQIWTWGSNAQGQLGHGDLTQRNYPVRIVNQFLFMED